MKKVINRLIAVLTKLNSVGGVEPVVYESYPEALINNSKYFFSQIDKCIDPYGFSYSNGWQVFTSIVKNIDKYPSESVISKSAESLRLLFHKNAFDGFRIELKNSKGLKDYPAVYLPFLTPWSLDNLSSLESRIGKVLEDEKLVSDSESGKANPLRDPVFLATNHCNRLLSLRNSIVKNGYRFNQDPDDPVKGFVLVREADYRILIFSGQHRVAVLAGLNHIKIPLRLSYNYIVRAEDCRDWPLVKSGLWDKDDALLYFNHLFDFDSNAWARRNRLLI